MRSGLGEPIAIRTTASNSSSTDTRKEQRTTTDDKTPTFQRQTLHGVFEIQQIVHGLLALPSIDSALYGLSHSPSSTIPNVLSCSSLTGIHRAKLLTTAMSFLVAYTSLARTAPNHGKGKGKGKGENYEERHKAPFKDPSFPDSDEVV
ncbi:hypothetical protein K435DRAFT_877465 [Dendrothele bispora CBS 962.96]|uniref:Uncharacterized protein n=1 Tax=Dendrothele bispora (strain CBS 962.96) TaxID=1314807 RepID=A0A4S8KQ94_DENBC|nr:hypothetical protein K435DRAFT_877465 [Dendrothele bispora CBS 962.96]